MTPQLIGYDEYGNPIYVDAYGNYIDPVMLSDGAIPASSSPPPQPVDTVNMMAAALQMDPNQGLPPPSQVSTSVMTPTGELLGPVTAENALGITLINDPYAIGTTELGVPVYQGDATAGLTRQSPLLPGAADAAIVPASQIGPPPPDANIPVDPDSGGGSGGGSGRSGRGSGGSSGGGSSGRSSDDGESFFRGRDPMDNIPAYADGRVHPAAGGDSLRPGGQFNDGSSGRGWAKTASGGSTRRYYRPGYERRYNKAPGNTFGLGRPDMPYRKQQALERHWNVRNQIMGQLPPILGGGGGTAAAGTAAGGGGGTGRDPVQGETGTRRLRGWAGRQGYTGAGLKQLLDAKPEALLMDVFPGISTSSAAYQTLRAIPTSDLVMLANAGNKKWLGEIDTTANTMAKMWREVATKPRWFDFQSLFRNLATAKKGSPLHKLTAGGTAAQNEYYFDKYFNALADTTMSADTALAYKQHVEDLQTQYMNMMAKRKNPAKGPSMGQWVGKRLYR